MRMWHPKLQYQLTFEGSWPTAVTFLDSHRHLVAGNQQGKIFAWELHETPPVLGEIEPGTGARKAEAPNVPPVSRWDGHTNAISQLLFDARRRQVVSASFDRTLRVWDLNAPSTETVEAVLDVETRRAEHKRTKREEVLSAPGVTVQLRTPTKTLLEHSDWIHALAMTEDGSRLISGDAAAEVVVWDREHDRPLARWKGHPWNWIVALDFSPDGETAVISEYRYKRDDFDIPAAALKIWGVADGSVKLDLLKVQVPKLNPSDHSYGGAQQWRKFTGNGLVAVAFSPDGTMIAAGQGGETDTGRVHLLDSTTGKLVRDVAAHQYGVTALRFCRDGSYLFTAGRDTCIRICRVADGEEVGVLGKPRGGQFKDWISAFALSADESHLAAADVSGHIAVWRLIPE